MTRVQLLVVVVIAVIIAAVAVPKAVRMSRISRAEHHILAIASGFARCRADTGQECTGIENLLKDPGVPGWMGPYINKKMTRNPWGDVYGVQLQGQKAGIPRGNAAPDKYEFGGPEEMSFGFSKEMGLE